MFTPVGTHDNISRVFQALWRTKIAKDALQLIYDSLGFAQGRVANRKNGFLSFNSAHPFGDDEIARNGNYNAGFQRKVSYVEQDDGQKVKQVVKVDKDGKEVAEGFDEGAKAADPMDDEGEYLIVRVCKLFYNTDTHNRKHSDKNPCIEHAYLHKTMMQGGGIEVEIIQEPDLRYVECYKRQRLRQERERLRELCRLNCCVDQPLKTSLQKRSGRRIFGK